MNSTITTLSSKTVMNTHKRGAQKGISLMEVLLVIAIFGFLVIGGLTLFVQAQNQARSQRSQQQVSNIVSSIRSLYAGSATYTGITAQVMCNAGAVPQDMDDCANNAMVNIFGGAVTVDVGTVAASCPAVGTAAQFCVTFTNVPDDACVILATAPLGANTVGVGANNDLAANVTVPVATGWCNAGANTITYLF